VDELASFLSRGNRTWEIFVVDDGGGDFPSEPWKGAPPARLIRLPENRGKGAAVRAGMLAASGRARVFTDADLPFDLELIAVMAEYLLRREFHLVIGDRALPDSHYASDLSWQRRIASRAFSLFVGKLVTGDFFDTQCGLKGFRGDVAEALFPKIRIDGFAFDVEVLYVALKYRLDIKRVPVRLRKSDSSSVRLLSDSTRMFFDVFRLKAYQLAGRYRSAELESLLAREFEEFKRTASGGEAR
jgi:glycosyltransferase involved in cell wall biosynthesis